MKYGYLKCSLMLAFAATAAWADQPLTINFTQCTEFAGVGPVNYANASALVPRQFTALSTGVGTAGIVVRAGSCTGVSVNGGHSIPTVFSQVGVEIVPPDKTGDINNYLLFYITNNPELVVALNLAGAPALYDPNLTYQFTYGSTGKSGVLYVEAEAFGVPSYTIYGTETDPTAPYGDFTANWWALTPQQGLVKEAGNYPNISFGTANNTVFTDKNSELGKLIGGNTDSNFSYLPLRGIIPTAQIVVTVSK
jgi:hypothetical protein